MRRIAAITLALLVLAVIETSVFPAIVVGDARPNLVLVATGVWASLGAPYALIWSFVGGLMLDVMSAAPTGMFAFSLMLGNIVANVLEFAPIPVRWFRAATWVAIVTLVAHSLWIGVIRASGQPTDLAYATTSIITPLLLLNPVAAIFAFIILSRVLERWYGAGK